MRRAEASVPHISGEQGCHELPLAEDAYEPAVGFRGRQRRKPLVDKSSSSGPDGVVRKERPDLDRAALTIESDMLHLRQSRVTYLSHT